MRESEYKEERAGFRTVDSPRACHGCEFFTNPELPVPVAEETHLKALCLRSPCTDYVRSDRRDVIFILESKRDETV